MGNKYGSMDVAQVGTGCFFMTECMSGSSCIVAVLRLACFPIPVVNP